MNAATSPTSYDGCSRHQDSLARVVRVEAQSVNERQLDQRVKWTPSRSHDRLAAPRLQYTAFIECDSSRGLGMASSKAHLYTQGCWEACRSWALKKNPRCLAKKQSPKSRFYLIKCQGKCNSVSELISTPQHPLHNRRGESKVGLWCGESVNNHAVVRAVVHCTG